MPCYDPETHDRPIRLAKKVHDLTAMLCWLCGMVERVDSQFIKSNPKLDNWWEKHKEFDREGDRIVQKVEVEGLKTLTPEEQSHYYARQRKDPENP